MNDQNESMYGLNYTIPAPHLVDMESVSNFIIIVQE